MQTCLGVGQVSEILERVLGTYFEGIDTESLHVSVFSGTVVLDNLRMRPTAFSALGLPLAVKHGRVRHVELELSLRNLRGTPARMHIDGIDIVVDPNDTAKGAQPDDLQTLTARKRALQKDRDDRRQALLAPKDGSNVCIYVYTCILEMNPRKRAREERDSKRASARDIKERRAPRTSVLQLSIKFLYRKLLT